MLYKTTEKRRAYFKDYTNQPKVKEKKKAYYKVYVERPGVKERIKVNRDRPEAKEKTKVYQKAYRQRPKAKERRKIYGKAFHLQRKYGLTLEAFEAMLTSQSSVCAVCGSADWGHKGPVIDHEHGSGVVRGILCFGCNVAAGMINDDEARARKLAEYLSRRKDNAV